MLKVKHEVLSVKSANFKFGMKIARIFSFKTNFSQGIQ